jgi:hypothetical protein
MSWTDRFARFIALVSGLRGRVARAEATPITRGTNRDDLGRLGNMSTAEVVERIRAIGKRVALRNRDKATWPAANRSIRELAHHRDRF